MSNIVIYTDGSYMPSIDSGGIGIVILKNNEKILEYSNQYKRCTNNLMELGAIVVALRLITEPCDSIIVYSDSMYCIGTITKGWQRKKNKRMWLEFDLQKGRIEQTVCPNIKFEHVKGHQSNNATEQAYWNNYVDKLATFQSALV